MDSYNLPIVTTCLCHGPLASLNPNAFTKYEKESISSIPFHGGTWWIDVIARTVRQVSRLPRHFDLPADRGNP